MTALDEARLCLASDLTIYGKHEYRRIIEGLIRHIELVTPTPGYCLLNVPRDSDEKPSPCAMAGFCLQAHGNDRRKGVASKSLWDRVERRKGASSADLKTLERWEINTDYGNCGIARDPQGTLLFFDDVEKMLQGKS